MTIPDESVPKGVLTSRISREQQLENEILALWGINDQQKRTIQDLHNRIKELEEELGEYKESEKQVLTALEKMTNIALDI